MIVVVALFVCLFAHVEPRAFSMMIYYVHCLHVDHRVKCATLLLVTNSFNYMFVSFFVVVFFFLLANGFCAVNRSL